MPIYTIWVLPESQVSISGPGNATLDGITQGDGSHLAGRTIMLSSLSLTPISVNDGGGNEINFADNDGTQRLNGAQTLDGIPYNNNTQIEAEYEFVVRDPNTGIDYKIIAVNIRNSSPAYGTNEGIAFVDTPPPVGVALQVVTAGEGPPNNGSSSVPEQEVFAPCLCRGSRVKLSHGSAPIETLKEGDQVLRADRSSATLRRIFKTTIASEKLRRHPNLYPVKITAGALGNGLPEKDLWVSRQHRMLVSSKIALRMFGVTDVLISAAQLTALPGVFVDYDVTEVTYFHLLFDQHEVIFAEGAPTESLFTGPEALKAVGPEARAEILALFPELRFYGNRPSAARVIPPRNRQKKLIARHLRNRKPLVRQEPRARGFGRVAPQSFQSQSFANY